MSCTRYTPKIPERIGIPDFFTSTSSPFTECHHFHLEKVSYWSWTIQTPESISSTSLGLHHYPPQDKNGRERRQRLYMRTETGREFERRQTNKEGENGVETRKQHLEPG